MAQSFTFERPTDDDLIIVTAQLDNSLIYLFDEPESNYKGVIGLDFLFEKEFCINLKNGIITLK